MSASDTTGDRFSGTLSQPIFNNLAGPSLDVIAITDPSKLRIIVEKTADQLNKQSGGPVFTDLSDRIADIQVQTSAQGASILEIHVIDPTLTLLRHPAKADDPYSTFIQVADDGYLDPPIEVHFPVDTETVWRLCAVRASTMDSQSTEANVILTFEDKIASVLREINAKSGGVKQSNPNESLEDFMVRVVRAAISASGVDFGFHMLVDETKDPNSATQTAAQHAASQETLTQVAAGAASGTQAAIDAFKKRQANGAAAETSIAAIEAAVGVVGPDGPIGPVGGADNTGPSGPAGPVG